MINVTWAWDKEVSLDAFNYLFDNSLLITMFAKLKKNVFEPLLGLVLAKDNQPFWHEF